MDNCDSTVHTLHSALYWCCLCSSPPIGGKPGLFHLQQWRGREAGSHGCHPDRQSLPTGKQTCLHWNTGCGCDWLVVIKSGKLREMFWRNLGRRKSLREPLLQRGLVIQRGGDRLNRIVQYDWRQGRAGTEKQGLWNADWPATCVRLLNTNRLYNNKISCSAFEDC